jgi:hypothetical protein
MSTSVAKDDLLRKFRSFTDHRALLHQTLLVLSPIVFSLWFGYLKVTDRDYARDLLYENGVLEWFQFFCFTLAWPLALGASWIHYRLGYRSAAIVLLALGAAVCFVALEEISWGQWLLDIRLPAFFEERNSQKNLTLHNLDFVQPHLHLISALLTLSVSVVALLRPWLLSFRPVQALGSILPSPILSLYFAPLALFYLFTDLVSPKLVSLGHAWARVAFDHRDSMIIFSDQEAIECLLAAGVLGYAGMTLLTALTLKPAREGPVTGVAGRS